MARQRSPRARALLNAVARSPDASATCCHGNRIVVAMSYCRFSSLNWSCDVYAYADVAGGYTIHVARSRRVGDIPADPFESFMSVDFKNDPKASAEWLRLYKE